MFGMVPFDYNNHNWFDAFDNFEKNFFGNSNVDLPDFRTDIRAVDDKYILEAELPGFNKEDIQLDVKDGILTITAQHTENEDEIQAAYEWLLEMNNTMEPVYVTDEVIDGMANGNKDIAVMYSGDAAYVLDTNEDMSYWMPTEGTNLWSDAMVIPANAENPALAHEFINFMLDDENALSNTEEVGYTSTVKSAFEEMKNGTYEGIDSYIPKIDNPKNEIFGYQKPKIKQKFAELWTKVKAK